MGTKGDKFTNKDLEKLRAHVVGNRSGPRAQSDYQDAIREIKKGPSYRRKWRKAMKAQRRLEEALLAESIANLTPLDRVLARNT